MKKNLKKDFDVVKLEDRCEMVNTAMPSYLSDIELGKGEAAVQAVDAQSMAAPGAAQVY
uniref:Uncharacterized protein n=1 Tax=Hallella multisaccharivorax DSM 17128 TaxID=688246 RepID=F8N562_9BACT|nr:hypothetical protein [Hallella multisaccharivorax]EGN58223.1 hypothetical protein Premu_0013 [Hallella multisaccharivorax DSM 17128]EGN58226.1 hypothetical protein Premu_0016 [Hallella multisaccharivorax DSM 17128]EGN58227.1 hypothetical protein Premu_0017 [Hallella multisaccharivorax DSM 17128]EGN58266.1 hypothetical protein Premu_0062 [Hallella multisaccharivorax DSM 17128]EGN58267.1 hypothetical protein Premu_0063 [Hallella multisaccharivorax DSM 17128]